MFSSLVCILLWVRVKCFIQNSGESTSFVEKLSMFALGFSTRTTEVWKVPDIIFGYLLWLKLKHFCRGLKSQNVATLFSQYTNVRWRRKGVAITILFWRENHSIARGLVTNARNVAKRISIILHRTASPLFLWRLIIFKW